ncbi:MAG TPA: hypothetical protein VGN07_08090 [Steroidobacteraceae bacterium]
MTRSIAVLPNRMQFAVDQGEPIKYIAVIKYIAMGFCLKGREKAGRWWRGGVMKVMEVMCVIRR